MYFKLRFLFQDEFFIWSWAFFIWNWDFCIENFFFWNWTFFFEIGPFTLRLSLRIWICAFNLMLFFFALKMRFLLEVEPFYFEFELFIWSCFFYMALKDVHRTFPSCANSDFYRWSAWTGSKLGDLQCLFNLNLHSYFVSLLATPVSKLKCSYRSN